MLDRFQLIDASHVARCEAMRLYEMVSCQLPIKSVYGSFQTKEITFGVLDDYLYLLSDLDLDNQYLNDECEVVQWIENCAPELKLDISFVSKLDSISQQLQRRASLGTIVEASVAINEIQEAICIRVFYSTLDSLECFARDDFLGLFYAHIRLVSEIPLYYCWSAGKIVGGYKFQLQEALDTIGKNSVLHNKLIHQAVCLKVGGIYIDPEMDPEVARYAMREMRILYSITTDPYLQSKNRKFVCDSLQMVRLEKPSSSQLWNLYNDYCAISKDGNERNRYLSNRIEDILNAPNNTFQSTRIPLRSFSACELGR